jgi:hypothetical protein
MLKLLPEALIMAKIKVAFVALCVVVGAFWGVGLPVRVMRACLYGVSASGTVNWVAMAWKLALTGLMLMRTIEVARRRTLIAVRQPGKA